MEWRERAVVLPEDLSDSTNHGLPTPRTTLRARYVALLVCQAEADLQALVDAGKGDVPLKDLRFRCSRCRSDLTDCVVTAKETRPMSR